MKKLHVLIASLLSGCTGIPEGLTVIDGFEVDRYLGGCPRIGTVARESHFESDFLVI